MPHLRNSFAILTAITCAIAASPVHADMLIDNYNQNYVNPNGSYVYSADILGGVRSVYRFGQASVSLDGTSESLIAYGNSWGGPATQITAADWWGRNLNLNLNTYSGVQINFSVVNQPIDLAIFIQRGPGTGSYAGWYSIANVSQGETSVFLPFSNFWKVAGTNTALDLSDIDSVGAQFRKSNAYLDVPYVPIYSVDSIKFTSVAAPVPEPETYSLLITGLGLIGAIARRKRKNQPNKANSR